MKSPLNALDYYVTAKPSPQNAVNIFKGDWSSNLPDLAEPLVAGNIPLFEDDRVKWAINTMGGVTSKRVLELGPLEGGHSYMLHQAGAREVVSIEANARAFLKCLITKELYGLSKIKIGCGDFVEYLKNTAERFDVAIACGVLYHMQNPLELIDLLSNHADRIFVWTHYYEESIVQSNPALGPRFNRVEKGSHSGFKTNYYRQEYQTALEWSGFCGGSAPTSHWLSRQAILDSVGHFGLTVVAVAYDEPFHPNGPCFAFVAERR